MSNKILSEDWEFNILGVYNYRKSGPLQYYFDYIIENHHRFSGNLVEAGVYRGRSLISMGLLLKELGSDKIIYGYDTWAGFPPIYHDMDDFSQWDRLLKEGRITKEHFGKIIKKKDYRSFSLGKDQKITAANSALSGDFSSCSMEEVQNKLDFLGLNNVKLIKGPFDKTMITENAPFQKLMAVFVDADLYLSYKTCLPFAWQFLEKGGYISLDEYYSLTFPGARIATDEFFANLKDKPRMHKLVEGDFERWHVRRLHS